LGFGAVPPIPIHPPTSSIWQAAADLSRRVLDTAFSLHKTLPNNRIYSIVLRIMLMMRLQRVGRKNDPSYRFVVVDKRTGPKSNKNIDILGSYNPKLGQVQIDADKAKDWLTKGVQPSDTVHNILVAKKVIEGKKRNALPKKSPIVDEEAIKKAEEEAKAKAEAEQAAVEASVAEVTEEASSDEDALSNSEASSAEAEVEPEKA